MGDDGQQLGPEEQVRQLFGQAEKQTGAAMEQLGHRDALGEILARATENVMGRARLGFDVLDLTVRNLRIAGRADLIRLGRQLARNEDKLERVLQEVERLQDEVRQIAQIQEKPPARRRGSPTSTRSNGSASSSSSKRRSGGSNG